MSQVKMETIWQHHKVLPYILNDLKQKIETITPVLGIYLYGSRAKTPYKKWTILNGKDWDIMVICAFPIVNTHIWTTYLNYHIDLKVITQNKCDFFKHHQQTMIELYPNNMLEIQYKKQYDGHKF